MSLREWRRSLAAVLVAIAALALAPVPPAQAEGTKTVDAVVAPDFMEDKYTWSYELKGWPESLQGEPASIQVTYANGNTDSVPRSFYYMGDRWRYSSNKNTLSDGKSSCVVSAKAVVPVEYTGTLYLVEGPCSTIDGVGPPKPTGVLNPAATIVTKCRTGRNWARITVWLDNTKSARDFTYRTTRKVFRSDSVVTKSTVDLVGTAKVGTTHYYGKSVLKVRTWVTNKSGSRTFASAKFVQSRCR